MAFFSGKPFRELTVLAQDPSVCVNGQPLTTRLTIPNETLDEGPAGHRFRVIDYDVSTNRLRPPKMREQDDPFRNTKNIKKFLSDGDFHAQNVFAIAAHTLFHFESALGRRVTWGSDSGTHYMKIAPHAFADANAFYSRRDEALLFGYFPSRTDRRSQKFVYTCLSFDVVAHETTHAILDGLRREYAQPSSPDQAAFHEGFADIVAMLLGLSRRELLDFAVAGGASHDQQVPASRLTTEVLQRSVLFGLAEQVGGEVNYDQVRRRRGDALRRSVQIAKSRDAYKRLQRSGEAHDLGELLVAVVMRAYLQIWHKRMETLHPQGLFKGRGRHADRSRVVEEGAKAAQHLLHMVIRAIDYMPPVNASFSDFLTALLTADREAVPNDERYAYRSHLLAAFEAYGILPSKPRRKENRRFARAAGPGMWTRPPKGLVYGFSGFAEMTWDRESVFRFIWENRRLLELDDDAFTRVISVRPSIRVGPDGFTLRETIAEYLQTIDLYANELRHLGVRRPEGMKPYERVELFGGGTLVFDDYGRLKYHIGSSVRSDAQSARLQSRWEHGEFDDVAERPRRFQAMHRARAFRESSRKPEAW